VTQIRHLDQYIDGEFIGGAQRFEDINPVDGTVIAEVVESSAEDVDRAVGAAKRALKGPWGALSQQERGHLLTRVADGIMERFDDFLHAEIADTGKPQQFARSVDIPRGAANFRVFADQAKSFGSDSYMQATPDGHGAVHYVQRNPIGVVGIICPWNLPLLLMTWKVAPALAAGNTVVVKPSEETPHTATLLAEVIDNVGIPKGVFNVVHGFGPASAGQAITQHPDVGAITFTGESKTGTAIMRDAAPGIKKLSFELGGKNPAIVFADADLEKALEGTVRSVFSNCGQVCLCSERVYVERPIFEAFLEGLVERAGQLRPGDPYCDQTSIGPLISRGHREKVLSYYALAQTEGAEIVLGGGKPEMEPRFAGGSFVEPTIWTGLKEDARCVKEEIFGPVCHVCPFDDEEEVIAMANDTEYGLAAALWTTDLSRAHRLAHRIETGIVWVNSWFLRDLRTPFGGVKSSGIGREGGVYSQHFYSELKNICIKL
jgi:aminomuconate-semialdehyde/2-hydroxymuconate-6-semialdehyde dehydrogenase